MNEFTFEETLWETALDGLQPGDSFSAVQLLALLEGESEYALEDALQRLEDGWVTLDITGLPADPGTGETALRLQREEALAASADLLTALEEGDPLRLYLEELARIPVCGDVDILAEDAAAGSETARNMLVNLMLSRVVALAREYVGRGVLLLDLIQEGGMGMWQGILNWNGDGDFTAHADWWIRQYLGKAVVLQARESGLGRKLRQAAEDFRSVDERLLTELGRNPTPEEMAEGLHITPGEVTQVAKMLENARIVASAKAPVREEIPEEEDLAVEDTAYFQSRQRVAELLSGLTEQETRVLSLRFGLEGGLPLSPEDTGRKLGMTPEKVTAMEAAALAKLRK